MSKENDSSPERCPRQESSVPNHSTPIREKNNSNHVEESSDIDNYSSPILLPCTQDGGNEVAWDWQSSLNRTPNSRNKKKKVQCNTPKGTKMLQKKRNSNSPLLYKPLKRKTIKMENIENIGQFAAELQALNKQIGIIKQNEKNDSGDCVKEDTAVVDTSDNEGLKNEQNYREESNDPDNIGNMNTSYGDLFDDSIDDSMARCTQEIEEKFNLISVDRNSAVHSQTSIKDEDSLHSQTSVKREQLFCTNKINTKATSEKSISDKKFEKSTLVKSFSCQGSSDNAALKTYSKFLVKRDVNSSVQVPPENGSRDLHKTCLNNNMMQYCIEKPCDNKKPPKDSFAELFDVDDSFDDCLATCVEELLPGPNDFSARRDNTIKVDTSSLTHVPLKGTSFRNSFVLETKPANSLKTARVEVSTVNSENRKFFKTKSLSDQFISQDVSSSAKNTTGGARTSHYVAKSASHLNPLVRANTMRASVSTKPLGTNNHCKTGDGAILLTRNANRMHESDVNRSAVRNGDRFVKYNSTGNMKNDTKETTKISSQPIRCTAEEIEKKRLQAKMRLEARRKFYLAKNNINR